MIDLGIWAVSLLMLMGTCDTSRMVQLEGTVNFRDLGGYATANGKIVKSGLVYRSGDLDLLTDVDLRLLADMGLKTVIDFRSNEEVQAAPDRLPGTVKNAYHLAVDPGNIFELSEVNHETGPGLMQKLNVLLVNDAKAQYAEFFRVLAESASAPLVFHCSAGKDRTGYAAALFLAALGVDRETIYADYMVSAPYAEAKYSGLLRKYPELLPAITVRREYLVAAFDEIDRSYGGVEIYLTRELKVDLNLLQSLYTE